MSNFNILIIMANRPQMGATKTRLSPPCTLEQAAGLYACFLKDALALARSMTNVIPAIAYTPDNQETLDWFGDFAPNCLLIPQRGETLGDRLDYVLSESLGTEIIGKAVAIRCDTPALPPALVQQGFTELDDPAVDITFGPCDDGSFYLIGWKQPHPNLLPKIKDKTENLCSNVLNMAKTKGLSAKVLPEFFRVSSGTDLMRVRRVLEANETHGQHTKSYLQKHRELTK